MVIFFRNIGTGHYHSWFYLLSGFHVLPGDWTLPFLVLFTPWVPCIAWGLDITIPGSIYSLGSLYCLGTGLYFPELCTLYTQRLWGREISDIMYLGCGTANSASVVGDMVTSQCLGRSYIENCDLTMTDAYFLTSPPLPAWGGWRSCLTILITSKTNLVTAYTSQKK